mmetsp:Transcript_132790/g.331282  ORF Transcript_132790/g.331282 Transcript_132790/m.331282 type:complete len:155 (-) Transcript_132790:44-508(-)
MDFLDERLLFICDVSSDERTPLGKYNAGVPEDRRIRPGDYIMEVNGERESAQVMNGALRNVDKLDLLVLRPNTWQRQITKDPTSGVGLELSHARGTSSLVIQEVREGGVVSREAPEVQPGDRITAVDGVTGTPDKLMRTIAASTKPVIQFSRAL